MVVGVHTLEKIVPTMMAEAGFRGKFTLHSLRATCATRLYESGVDEQAIQEVTGHTSNAVRAYKRTSDGMKKNLSHILRGEENTEKSVPVDNSEEKENECFVVASQSVQAVKNETMQTLFSNCSFSNCSFQL